MMNASPTEQKFGGSIKAETLSLNVWIKAGPSNLCNRLSIAPEKRMKLERILSARMAQITRFLILINHTALTDAGTHKEIDTRPRW